MFLPTLRSAFARRTHVLSMALGILASTATFAEDVDYSNKLPRIEPTEPDAALATFVVADGFEFELVASEPLIGSPVAVEWDAEGAMYVCEMRGYSENRDDGISSIARLTDQDGDGVYDRRTDFATGLNWPTGLFPYQGGLFVGDAPDLLYLKDQDGDGVADESRRVLTGFGTSNVQGLMNSFRWGLDNRIHIACSSSGGEVHRAGDPASTAVSVRGRDIALDPRTYRFELTSGAAQHGMCFDDWGRKFVSSNSDHIQQVMYEDRYIARNPFVKPPPARISIAADGPQAEVFRTSPVEPWRILRTELRVSGKASGPIEGGGRAAGYFTGATGITLCRGDAWPESAKGIAVVGDVGGNLIHRKQLDPKCLEFVAHRIDEQSEWVSSTDTWFRPAQFANAPDGSLHVVDVYREVIEHPLSLPPEIKKHLDLTAGRDRGRIYRIAPRGHQPRATPRLDQLTTTELVQMLEHPNAWHRETAARLLFEKQDRGAVEPLRQLAGRSASPLARMHALRALDGIGHLDAETLLPRLDDGDPHVRQHAVRLLENVAYQPVFAERVAALAMDESLHVRYQVAFTVGSLPLQNRSPILASLIQRDIADRWMRAAVLSSLSADAAEVFRELVGTESFRSPEAKSFLKQLLQQVTSQNRESELRQAVRAVAGLPGNDPLFSLTLIRELQSSEHRADSHLQTLRQSEEFGGLASAAEAAVAEALAIAENPDAAIATRVVATELAGVGEWHSVKDSLQSLLHSQQPHPVQKAAIETLGRYQNDEAVATLLESWSELSPSLRAAAEEAVCTRAASTLALLDAVERGEIRRSDLSLARLQQLQKSPNSAVRTRATALLESRPNGQRGELVTRYRDALALPHDVERGRELFKKHCSSCHRVDAVGHEIGPNLETIRTRGAETVLTAVLDPNREVNPQYLNYIASTVDGRILSGLIADEGATSITLRRGENAEDTLLRIDIDQFQSTGLSIMPEGFEDALDPQAMADLIGYLMQAT